MANTTERKRRKAVAFPNSGSNFSNILTCLLILGLALILRSGLITLSIRKALRFKSTAMNSRML